MEKSRIVACAPLSPTYGRELEFLRLQRGKADGLYRTKGSGSVRQVARPALEEIAQSTAAFQLIMGAVKTRGEAEMAHLRCMKQ